MIMFSTCETLVKPLFLRLSILKSIMVSKQEIFFIMCTLNGEDVKNMGHVCSID